MLVSEVGLVDVIDSLIFKQNMLALSLKFCDLFNIIILMVTYLKKIICHTLQGLYCNDLSLFCNLFLIYKYIA